jgi:hypothetical protein
MPTDYDDFTRKLLAKIANGVGLSYDDIARSEWADADPDVAARWRRALTEGRADPLSPPGINPVKAPDGT